MDARQAAANLANETEESQTIGDRDVPVGRIRRQRGCRFEGIGGYGYGCTGLID